MTMLLNILNVLYLLVAISMVAFILLQRGPGATAGSGFGAGASATVFGARGSANFLSRSTAVLAVLFFALSLGMAMYVSRSGEATRTVADLGVMGEVPAPSGAGNEATPGSEVPAGDALDPAAQPAGEVPVAPASEPSEQAPAAEVPAASGEQDGEAAPREDASGQ